MDALLINARGRTEAGGRVLSSRGSSRRVSRRPVFLLPIAGDLAGALRKNRDLKEEYLLRPI
jgi:hypothetical protein